jgi:[ribosomal protein S18]-alanine N-acetyltransferase
MNPCRSIEIVLMRDSHLAAVSRIEREVFRDPWPTNAFLEVMVLSDKCWVALADGDVAGYLITQWVLDEVHILNIAVARDRQRQGIARVLLNELFCLAAAHGMCDMFLEVRASNAAAQALYRAFGFQDISSRKRYYSDGEDALIMQAAIAAAPRTAESSASSS